MTLSEESGAGEAAILRAERILRDPGHDGIEPQEAVRDIADAVRDLVEEAKKARTRDDELLRGLHDLDDKIRKNFGGIS